MKFQSVKLANSKGHILAHSVALDKGALKKGITLTAEDIDKLDQAGHEAVTVAMLEKDDVPENIAAETLANKFKSKNIEITAPFVGRVNLIAKEDGVTLLNTKEIEDFNAVDEAITIATLPNYTKVKKGALLATIKIIPYAVPAKKIERAEHCIQTDCFKLHPFLPKSCDIILTRTNGFKKSLLDKAEKAIEARVSSLNMQVKNCVVAPHSEHGIMEAVKSSVSDVVLILGASATSDRRDVVPAGIELAGGHIVRFGMPVDPGNLLVLGGYSNRHVVGLPGCARAPALNGADWVLERLCAGLSLNSNDVAKMGVGGLLKEAPNRIQPRMLQSNKTTGTTAILLAAGSSRRMRGEDKLMRKIGGDTLLRRSVKVILASNADTCIVVLEGKNKQHREALKGLPAKIVETNDSSMGMSASLRAGVLGIEHTPNAIIVALADMPDLTPDHFNQVIAQHSQTENRLIVCPKTPEGKRGHPVLFDGSFIENLTNLKGDVGAKEILQTVPEVVHEVVIDNAVTVDLDTPEAWSQWEERRNG